MDPIRSRITTRPLLSFAGLAASLCLIAVGLSQCTLVDDTLTGVRISRSRTAASSCISQCQTTFQQAMKSENAIHVVRVKACGDNSQCLAAEQERHVAALRAIKAARAACINGCHSQGRGHGGS